LTLCQLTEEAQGVVLETLGLEAILLRRNGRNKELHR